MWTCEAGGGTLRALRYLRTGGGAQPKAECLLNGSSPVTRVKQQRRTWRRCDVHARDWTRTSTPLRALAPQASASTNSATRANRATKRLYRLSHIGSRSLVHLRGGPRRLSPKRGVCGMALQRFASLPLG